jgi:hypothetical protein
MNRDHVDALIKHLWPQGHDLQTPQIYALLDGARDPRIAHMVRYSGLEYACLYTGKISPALSQAAPYIVHLAPKSAFTRTLLEQGWGESWGIFVEARADVSLEQLRRHFKNLQLVRDEDGNKLVFRFYDPRVLRIYLPTCTLSELSEFFGPTSKLLLESDGRTALLEHRKIVQGMDSRIWKIEHVAQMPVPVYDEFQALTE